MSQHDCNKRLSNNRSKNFQEDGTNQQTMEVLVETLTGTAFEMTVSPSDTVFAIKSKIFRVEGIPVSQQHLVLGPRELEDARSLQELHVSDGARLRLVLGLRGGPVSTRRAPPAPSLAAAAFAQRDHREEGGRGGEWEAGGGEGCKVTVLVFRDGDNVNMLRVLENEDGTYSPLAHNRHSSSLRSLVEDSDDGEEPEPPSRSCADDGEGLSGSVQENAVTMGKMMELRRRMEALTLHRPRHTHLQRDSNEYAEPGAVGSSGVSVCRVPLGAPYAPLYNFNYNYDYHYHLDLEYDLDYDCSFAERYTVLPPIGRGKVKKSEDDEQTTDRFGERVAPFTARDYGVKERWGSLSVSSPELRAPQPPLPPLARHRPQLRLHALGHHTTTTTTATNLPPTTNTATTATTAAAAESAAAKSTGTGTGAGKRSRVRCLWCRKRLSIATEHRCRCGASFCAPHRYKEVHHCAFDYKHPATATTATTTTTTLPRI